MTSESRTDSGLHVVQYGGGEPPAPAEQPEDDRPKRTWRCKQGHIYTNTDPFLLQFLNQGKLVMRTDPLCPECFRKWLENRFEMTEVKDGGGAGHHIRMGSRASRRRGDDRH